MPARDSLVTCRTDFYGGLEELQWHFREGSDSAMTAVPARNWLPNSEPRFSARNWHHADYLGHWLTVLKEDKRGIFSAAADALRVADYLTGLQQTHVSAAA